jgi:predicted ATPase
MLERLRIKNFKLLRDVDLEFSADVPTVLIGPNASGKSTVIEVLDFLSRCANDGLQRAVTAHGGMAAIRTIGDKEPVEISSSWSFTSPLEPGDRRTWRLTWMIKLGTTPSGQVQLRSESLMDSDRKLLETTEDGHRLLYNESDPDEAPIRVESTQLAFEAHTDPQRYKGLWLLEIILGQIRVLGALSSIPSWAAASAERASARDAMVISIESFVGREGLGLATALYNLQTEHADA